MTDRKDILKRSWLIACQSKDLKKRPQRVTILSQPIVLFRSGNQVAALEDRCPHRNVPLSEGRVIDGKIQCLYHGWTFSSTGKCTSIPGRCKQSLHETRDANSILCCEVGDFIWVNLCGNQLDTQPIMPHLDKLNMHQYVWSLDAEGALLNVLENFLDGTHTHFIHRGLIRTEGNRQKIVAKMNKTPNTVQIDYHNETKQFGFISRIFEKNRVRSCGRFSLPSIAEIEYWSQKGLQFAITAYITPVSETKQRITAVISINKWGFLPAILKQWIINPFLYMALKQDQRILQQQQQNIEIFGKERFVSTELDLIRPHIESLLKGNQDTIYKEIILEL